MATIIDESYRLHIPAWVVDINAFRRWTDADDFPDQGRLWWLCGEVWADMSKEQIFSHVAVKTEITSVLRQLVKAGRQGLMLGDGLLLSNFEADISGNPDAMFLSSATLDSDRVRLIEGSRGGYTELQGSPDKVLEVLSESSVQKDTVTLRQAYWKAGIPEYWVVDARGEISFQILRHTARGYVAVRASDGWVKSAVFGKAFKFSQAADRLGHPEYTLHVR